MTEDDYKRIAMIERAIKDKYGVTTVLNPRAKWDEEKEKQFSSELGKVSAKLTPKNVDVSYTCLENCRHCKRISFEYNDDVYMTKYGLCARCYIITMEK